MFNFKRIVTETNNQEIQEDIAFVNQLNEEKLKGQNVFVNPKKAAKTIRNPERKERVRSKYTGCWIPLGFLPL